jgi:hypothetical protein
MAGADMMSGMQGGNPMYGAIGGGLLGGFF